MATTYNTFSEVSAKDRIIIDFIKKYGNGEKYRRFKSFKKFWKKYEAAIFIIGNGTDDDPEYFYSLMVERAQYIGQPDIIRIINDYLPPI